ncbi:hypothetical protein DM02DRAFT_540699 [Periconia macrospinosa]|uniref:Methyltransferase type 11 domain-containing protein n=1 Tax=Periconia macrospinosa TaxID=97972 RepID=A0A2V1D6Z5_9PLEO|nr:hypothetical protein DM02DRAFT_540699 [Periconia macrospinosa]
MSASPPTYPVRKYEQHHTKWPYKPSDFERYDESIDTRFYTQPRFVAHIDDAALSRLTTYYQYAVPLRGNVLDMCTPWRSRYTSAHEQAVAKGELKVFGIGLNGPGVAANPLFRDFEERFRVLDLNNDVKDVNCSFRDEKFVCVTCTVSIDYLVDAVDVLKGVRTRMEDGGEVHLAISSRSYPHKVVRIWEHRLGLVCDYLHVSDWKNIEIVDLCARDANEQQTITA